MADRPWMRDRKAALGWVLLGAAFTAWVIYGVVAGYW